MNDKMERERRAAKFEVLKERLTERPFLAAAHLSFTHGHIMEIGIHRIKPGITKPAHRHVNEAVLYVIQGRGYSTVKLVGEEVESRVDWQTGTVFHVPSMALHGHTNTGSKPALHLAVYPYGPGAFYLYERALREHDTVLLEQLGLPRPETMQHLLNTEKELIEAKTLEMMNRIFS